MNITYRVIFLDKAFTIYHCVKFLEIGMNPTILSTNNSVD